MDDDYNPYTDNLRRPARSGRRDPFLVLSRSAWPARKGRNGRPIVRPVERSIYGNGAPEPRRGVFEDDCPLPGLRTFAVIGPDGGRIATVTAVESIVDEAFVMGLEKLLNRYRPAVKLSII